MRLDQVVDAARPIGAPENHPRGRGQRYVQAVKLNRTLKTSARDRCEAMLSRSRQIDQTRRETGQKDEGLRAV